jgi:hypothetical protein
MRGEFQMLVLNNKPNAGMPEAIAPLSPLFMPDLGGQALPQESADTLSGTIRKKSELQQAFRYRKETLTREKVRRKEGTMNNRYWHKLLGMAVFAGALVSVTTLAKAQAPSCAALTPVAIQTTVDAITASIQQAQKDVAENSVTGGYPQASTNNLAQLVQARDTMKSLQDWLAGNNLASPFVSNQSGAYNVHNYARDTVVSLLYARHWGTISAVYNALPRNQTFALQSIDLTTAAIKVVDDMGVHGAKCYLGK